MLEPVKIKDFEHYVVYSNGDVINTKTNYKKKPSIAKIGYLQIDLYAAEGKRKKKFYIHRLLATYFIPNPKGKKEVNHKDGDKLNNSLDNLEWVTHKENMQHAHAIGLINMPRNMSDEDLLKILKEDILKEHKTLTEIAKEINLSLSQLSIHIKRLAKEHNLLDEYMKLINEGYKKRSKEIGKKLRKNKPINMIDLEKGEVIKTFSYLSEIKAFLNKKSSGPISNVLSGRTKTAYGYGWCYSHLNDYPEREYTTS